LSDKIRIQKGKLFLELVRFLTLFFCKNGILVASLVYCLRTTKRYIVALKNVEWRTYNTILYNNIQTASV